MRLGSDFTWFLAMYSAAGCARGVREDSDEGPKRGDFFGSAETDVSVAQFLEQHQNPTLLLSVFDLKMSTPDQRFQC